MSHKTGSVFTMPSVFLHVFFHYSHSITTGDTMMKSNIENCLRTMKTFWLKEPAAAKALGPFYLTPQQRYLLLKELMMPLSQTQNSGK
jgi:hypothetical protein